LPLLVTAGGIAALIQRNRADSERKQAVTERQQAIEQERSATARGLILQAEQLRDRNQAERLQGRNQAERLRDALRLGLAAETLAYSPETLASLEVTLAATPWIFSEVKDQNIEEASFSRDGRTLATTSGPSGFSHRLQMWDISNPRAPVALANVEYDQYLTSMDFSPDGRTLA